MEVNLKSDGWYNRLQEYVLGDNKPNLFSLCPYFWLTIFCIVVSPFVFIYKQFITGIKFIRLLLNKLFVNNSVDNYISNMTIDEISALTYGYENVKIKNLFVRRLYASYDIINKWKKMQQDAGKTEAEIDQMLYDFYDQWKLKREERRQDEIIRQNLIASKKQKIKERKGKIKNIWMPIVKWTQRIFNVIFTLLMLYVVSYIVIFGIVFITCDIIIKGLLTISILALVVSIMFILYILITMFIDNFEVGKYKYIMTPFKYIGIFFNYIFKGIKEFFVLFIEYFKANKNDYCPGINWDVKEDKK